MTSKGRKKRDRSTFDAVQLLESQDEKAERQQQTRTERQRRQGQAAQSQTRIYNSLLECRILLQRSMHQLSSSTADNAANGADENNATALLQCDELLVRLLEARAKLEPAITQLLPKQVEQGHPARVGYRELVQGDGSETDGSDLARWLDSQLESEYQLCREKWREVLNRRHQDVRLHSGLTAKSQFRVLESSFWQQVESTVQHEELRLQQQQLEGGQPIFDDLKVYQHLLKDFVATRQTGDEQLAKNRLNGREKSSRKKDVDRRASKGRKIRYTEISKLVNFTFPVSRPNSGSNLDEDEWFRSLFGGVGTNE